MFWPFILLSIPQPKVSPQITQLSPLVTNGLSHPYHLDESTFIFRGVRSKFSFAFHFSMKFMKANGMAPDGTPHFAASHLGLFCLPMSHKKGARLGAYISKRKGVTIYLPIGTDIPDRHRFISGRSERTINLRKRNLDLIVIDISKKTEMSRRS